MGRFICEVKKNHHDKELQLINTHHSVGTSEPGTIKFDNNRDMNKYFNKYCISEDVLKQEVASTNNLFTFLFYILLFVFITTMIWQVCNKNGNSSKISNTAFGRFSF
jgi:hypothetical protein